MSNESAPTSGGQPDLRTLHVVFGPEHLRRAYWREHGIDFRHVLHWAKAAEKLRGVVANIVLVDTSFQPSASQWQEWERVAHVAQAVTSTHPDATLTRTSFAQ